ncbi:hypothetical protein BJ170DRAFT_173265 [Xylariales sp. AK1849]|nr:hypothetical protein BJ170DRAFT_173265 [Xylariales sp. AK1849]
MFLHSGASLHGHEYSNKPSSLAGQAAHRRNKSFLPSSFAAPRNRASTHIDSRSPLPPTVATLKRVRPVSDCYPANPDLVVKFQDPEHGLVSSRTEAMSMSEDEGSADISDSDASQVTSSVSRRRRRLVRQYTSYLLAQAPPKLGTKQRLLHIRPKLLLQLQQLSADKRPRPTIDVYPSLGIANTAIAAQLCKRFPRLSKIRSEQSIQDVLLLKSEVYNASGMDTEIDEEDSIQKRDLIAILSPLAGQDKAEIVLADGNVWVAAPRVNGANLSYEFTHVDEHGRTMTARWVRRQIVSKSSPSTKPPSSPTPGSEFPFQGISPMSPLAPSTPSSPPLEHKFTFSIIDPECRRHPILATLTPSSLEIQDNYTTVSQSAGRHPPTSQYLGLHPTNEDAPPPERATRTVEDWQKTFIQVSALWVALRLGWVPHFRPADFIPQPASSPSSSTTLPPRRASSSSIGTEPGIRALSREFTGRLRHIPTAIREDSAPEPGNLPRRATSTGAARMQRLRAQQRSTSTEGSETDSFRSGRRRPLSDNMSGSITNRLQGNPIPLANILGVSGHGISQELPAPNPTTVPILSSPTSRLGRRPVSEYFPPNPMLPLSAERENEMAAKIGEPQPNPLTLPMQTFEHEAASGHRRHRWRIVTNWINRHRTQ